MRLLNTQEVCRMLGMSRSALYARFNPTACRSHQMDKTFPQPLRMGGTLKWKESELLAWIDSLADARKEM